MQSDPCERKRKHQPGRVVCTWTPGLWRGQQEGQYLKASLNYNAEAILDQLRIQPTSQLWVHVSNSSVSMLRKEHPEFENQPGAKQ